MVGNQFMDHNMKVYNQILIWILYVMCQNPKVISDVENPIKIMKSSRNADPNNIYKSTTSPSID